MNKYLIALFPFILTSCGTTQGRLVQDTYTAPNHELSTIVPNLPMATVREGRHDAAYYVEFMPGAGYWMIKSGYWLEWSKATKPTSDETLMQIKNKLINDVDKHGHIDNIDCKFISVQNNKGYQCKADGNQDNIPAHWIATSFVLEGRLVNTYIIYPNELSNMPIAPAHFLQENNKFLNSIKFNHKI